MTRTYCSDASRLRGDDNIATAARIDTWILVELPITWGHEPIADAAIPSPTRETLRNASHAIPRCRVVFIRKRVECLGPVRVYVVRSSPRPGILRLDLESIEDVANVPFAELAASPLPEHAEADRPLVLVCTHGQHDSCCGRRGYPLFDALQKRHELDVWQCSHIGGDRFAANAVVLPWGLYYGPVEPNDAGMLAETIVSGDVLLPSYRGRSSISRPVQAAETFVRRATGITARDAFRFVSRKTLADGTMLIHLRDDGGTQYDVTVEHYVAVESARLTCSAETDAVLRQFRMVDYRCRPAGA